MLISTVAVNLKDSAPFASLHRPDLSPEELVAWKALLSEGTLLEDKGRHDDALKLYLYCRGTR